MSGELAWLTRFLFCIDTISGGEVSPSIAALFLRSTVVGCPSCTLFESANDVFHSGVCPSFACAVQLLVAAISWRTILALVRNAAAIFSMALSSPLPHRIMMDTLFFTQEQRPLVDANIYDY